MPPFSIGYNINCEAPGADRQRAVDEQIELHSTHTLLMDDHKGDWFFSKQIKARSPETVRIHRMFMRKSADGGWDGNLWEAPDGNSPTGFLSPENYLNTLQGLNAPSGTVHQVLCEPDVHGERLRRKNKWLVECIRLASSRNMRLCVDNIQTVTLDGNEVHAGAYDELWFTLAQYPEHLYGVHAYWLGDAWFNTSAKLMHELTKRTRQNVTPFIDVTDSELQAAYVANAREAHLGREGIIAARCLKIGAKVPKMVYTEVGSDAVRLSEQAEVDAINGRPAMGYPTMDTYWAVRYAWEKPYTMFQQVRWFRRSLPAYIVGACLFGKDTSFENGAYHIADPDFQGFLRQYSAGVRSSAPVPPSETEETEEFPPAERALIIMGKVNLRDKPSVSGKVLALLGDGMRVFTSEQNLQMKIGNSKQWVSVDACGVAGYVNAAFIKVV